MGVNYYNLVNSMLVLVSISNLFLGLLVYSKQPKRELNKYFFAFSLSLLGWGVAVLLLNIYRSLFWAEMTFITGSFIGLFFLWFTFYFPRKRDFSLKIKILTFTFTILFGILVISRLVVVNIVPLSSGFRATLGPLYIIFIIYLGSYFFWGVWNVWSWFKVVFGIERTQIIFFLVGWVISIIAAFSTNLIMPSLGNFQGIALGPIFTFSIIICIAYAILRYRLMDIRIVIKRSAVFTLLVLAMTAIYAFVVIFLSTTFEELIGTRSLIVPGIFTAVLIALGFEPLKSALQRATDRFLFKGEYKPQELLAQLGEIITTTLDLQKILTSISDILIQAFRNSKMAIVLRQKGDGHFVLVEQKGFETFPKTKFDFDHPLIKYFQLNRNLVVTDELKRQYSQRRGNSSLISHLIKVLDKLQAAVTVPLYSKNKLLGLMLIDNKKSGDMYTADDLRVLDIISTQAATAIENARLYEEIKGFAQKLRKEVERATQELRIANQELKRLDLAKSEFISIASHQLRTPLTIVKGYVSMLLEGSFGRLDVKQTESLHKVYASNERLIQLVEDLLNISRIESGRMEFYFKTLQLEEVAQEAVASLFKTAKDKGLYLHFRKPEKKLPPVKVDQEKIGEVMNNIIDNAIKYTPKGGITVRVEAEKNKVIFSVSDTGVGIPKEELGILFQKFVRGKGMSLIHTEGTGLGLYVAKEIVKAHHGQIWVESKGRDQGSTFKFSLAAVKRRSKSTKKGL